MEPPHGKLFHFVTAQFQPGVVLPGDAWLLQAFHNFSADGLCLAFEDVSDIVDGYVKLLRSGGYVVKRRGAEEKMLPAGPGGGARKNGEDPGTKNKRGSKGGQRSSERSRGSKDRTTSGQRSAERSRLHRSPPTAEAAHSSPLPPDRQSSSRRERSVADWRDSIPKKERLLTERLFMAAAGVMELIDPDFTGWLDHEQTKRVVKTCITKYNAVPPHGERDNLGRPPSSTWYGNT